MKKFQLAVNDFALPSPRVGSIDTYSGFSLGSKRVIEIHQDIQSTLKLKHQTYESEVAITHVFQCKRMKFQISGRMDGIYRDEQITIEEIKTAFDTKKLIRSLTQSHYTHPYWLQLQTYGYLYWLKNNNMPVLQLLVVSLRDKKTTRLGLDFNIKAFEEWCTRRLIELVDEAQEVQKRIKNRQKRGNSLQFPFPNPRPNQKALTDTVFAQMQSNQPMLLQAPTGLGKASAILFPVLKESLKRGQKSIYLTPKNSQHHIAVDALIKMQSNTPGIKSLILTAKKKLCMKNEPLCNASYCEFAQNHHTKVTEHQLSTQIKKQKNLNAAYFKKMATDHQVCPYELQMQSIAYVDVVVGDYNHVFSSTNTGHALSKIHFSEQEHCNLVIDEAHNLISRSQENYSATLNAGFFYSLSERMTYLPEPIQSKVHNLLKRCIEIINQCALPQVRTPHRITLPTAVFKQHEEAINEVLNEYLESDITIDSGDPILNLCNYWSAFTQMMDHIENNEAFFTSINPSHPSINVTCCDASQLIKECYAPFKQVIGFSATLKPFDYYQRLMGLPRAYTQEFATPFSPLKRKILIIPQVSTKYSEREQHQHKLIEAIHRIFAVKPGNYLLFFPSFDYLNDIVHHFKPGADFIVLKQERKMGKHEVMTLLEKLEDIEQNHLFFAVQGGMFAEGIDYRGTLAIGAFIIGPPLPLYHWEREQMKAYYQSKYQAGTEYAYIYPAMAKAIQAAGRIIRSEEDKGIIVLFDNRFLLPTFYQSMPNDWFTHGAQELVSQSILKDVQDFWDDNSQ